MRTRSTRESSAWERSLLVVVAKGDASAEDDLFLQLRGGLGRRGGVRATNLCPSASVFHRTSGESQSLRMAWAEQYPDISVAGVLQKMRDKLGCDRWRRE